MFEPSMAPPLLMDSSDSFIDTLPGSLSQRVLIIDDDPQALESYRNAFAKRRVAWNIRYCGSADSAWEALTREEFDLVACGLGLPANSGLELLQRCKNHPPKHDRAFVVVAEREDQESRNQALALGAADFIVRPISDDDLYLRFRNILRAEYYARQLKNQANELDELVNIRTAELNVSQIEMILRLGRAAEFRDEDTSNHVLRVGCYSKIVARYLGFDDRFAEQVFLAAPLHDIGKIGVPDSILLKKGRLTDAEWHIMKEHCSIGASILSGNGKLSRLCRKDRVAHVHIAPRIPENAILRLAATIALSHHEKWDGSGYPYGLSGEDIPTAARIVAICDVYDALRAERPYKRSYSVEKSFDIISRGDGLHFDPRVLSAFRGAFDEIRSIEQELSDSSGEESEELMLEMAMA